MITTYDTLVSDFVASGGEKAFGDNGQGKDEAAAAGEKRKRRHGLMALDWHRIVLDEAHNIRSPATKRHKVREGSGWVSQRVSLLLEAFWCRREDGERTKGIVGVVTRLYSRTFNPQPRN